MYFFLLIVQQNRGGINRLVAALPLPYFHSFPEAGLLTFPKGYAKMVKT